MPFFDQEKFLEGQEETGKTFLSLANSRKLRSSFIFRYGGIPSSILIYDRKSSDQVILEKGRRYGDTSYSKRTGKKVLKAFEVSEQGRLPGKGTPFDALSTFPQNVGKLVTEFYCPEGGIVFDPFAGHNSRMELCFKLNLHYVGVDVSKEFMRCNRKIKDTLESRRGLLIKGGSIRLIEGSSSMVDLPNDHANFTITSPPYWDIEYYGDESEQLGNAKTYEEFLGLLSDHIKENFRVLKPGSYCCWFVNDFFKENIFYPYHSDLIYIFRKVGFEIFNVYIVDLGRTIAECFVQSIVKTKRFPKRHEYCLIFKKREK